MQSSVTGLNNDKNPLDIFAELIHSARERNTLQSGAQKLVFNDM